MLDALEIINTTEVGADAYEVCASCEAAFEDSESKLAVELNAFVRRFEIRGKDEISRPPWLPKPETVRMRVAREDASEAAKEVFASWVRRVRASIPSASEWARLPQWLQHGNGNNEQN
jgi:hypothetical protein